MPNSTAFTKNITMGDIIIVKSSLPYERPKALVITAVTATTAAARLLAETSFRASVL